jgi:hypothetical protein
MFGVRYAFSNSILSKFVLQFREGMFDLSKNLSVPRLCGKRLAEANNQGKEYDH